MPHVIQAAVSGRATCRACGERIAAGVRRFGEGVANPYADDGGETTHWYHLPCGAFRRPEAFLEALAASAESIDDRERLEEEAGLGLRHRRLPRVNTAERAPSGRAACRSCREKIARGTWRLSLVFYEEGRFVPSGFIHVGCTRAYLDTVAVLTRVRHFTRTLNEADVIELEAGLAG